MFTPLSFLFLQSQQRFKIEDEKQQTQKITKDTPVAVKKSDSPSESKVVVSLCGIFNCFSFVVVFNLILVLFFFFLECVF